MSIFVGNLPFRAEREDVLQLFAPFGEVLNCSLPLERDTGRKRGFAFIEMADEAIESTAIDGLQGTELMVYPLIPCLANHQLLLTQSLHQPFQ